jgi:Calcium binding
MPDPKKPVTTPRFKVGDKVRVKPGVTDPDFPDMPLGGWAGTVTEVIEHEGQVNCVFKLDDRTLASLHPIFERRSEIDGLDYKFMGLGQEDIEWDDGVLVPIEQPSAIVPRPLAMDDQDDRVRMAFGLTHDDFLPEVNGENHSTYYRYLLAHLTLPFLAHYRPGRRRSSGKPVRLTVTGLDDLDRYEVEEHYGLIGVGKEPGGRVEFPLTEIEGIEDKTNRRLIEDYAYWLANFG